jgi:N-acyl amino acid synthase of PEP-CTERM/exosortase system
MEPGCYSAAIAAVREGFATEFATTTQQLEEAFRLRHQVYCLERNFEPGEDGLERDEYDPLSGHVILRDLRTGQVTGTVRLVVPVLCGSGAVLPMERVASLPRLRQLPRKQLAEVSRFALSKCRRAASGTMGALLRLCLIRGIIQLSAEMGVTHWCALMEPKLLRLLQTSAIYFHQISGMVEHHGLRQPSCVGLGEMLDRVRHEKPAVWDFITDSGELWQPERRDIAA